MAPILAEFFRGAYLTIPKGQLEAGPGAGAVADCR